MITITITIEGDNILTAAEVRELRHAIADLMDHFNIEIGPAEVHVSIEEPSEI